MFTVLVTGSRTWDVADSLEMALDGEARRLGAPMRRDEEGHPVDWDWSAVGGLTIMHGACPEGGDFVAELYAQTHHVGCHRHPARWTRLDGSLDRAAGFRRNAEMVATMPDLVVGLVDRCAKPVHQSSPHGSHGAIHTLNLAMNARRRTIIFYRGFLLDEPLLQWAEQVIEL